ncbi:MAG: LytTR family transcriptional regulator DNA-binding domain-containing protein [Firmicutes bacterium]|nr:LytTR family transcriptional regulator DNA-binding domain-containing protein [Bacillota bacterium]
MLHIHLQEYDTHALKQLAKLCRDCFGLDWDARIQSENKTPKELLQQIKSADLPALFIMEDAQRNVLDKTVADIRLLNALHYLVLRINFAEDAVQVRPAYYRTCGFLLSPINRQYLQTLLDCIYNDFTATNTLYGGFFAFKILGTVYQIPYSKILFFESNSKKIIVRTEAQEYEFYDSIEEISANAPDFFLRVHRSFCVNLRQIDTLTPADKTIILKDGSFVPFSRTFKQKLLEAVGG